MDIFKKMILIIVAIIFSYFSAGYTGSMYTEFIGSGSAWIGSEDSWNFIIGLPLSLIFFLTFFATLVFKKYSSVLWLISPLIIWEISFDLDRIYLPVILGLIAFTLAKLIKKLLGSVQPSQQV